jgi:L-lactate dehydrogenase complex protein LldE
MKLWSSRCGYQSWIVRSSRHKEVVSSKVGYDDVSDHAWAGAECIVSADISCVIHQQGYAKCIGVPIKFIHIARSTSTSRRSPY